MPRTSFSVAVIGAALALSVPLEQAAAAPGDSAGAAESRASPKMRTSLRAEPLFLGGDGRIRGPLLEILDEWPVYLKDPPQLSHRRGMLVNPQVDAWKNLAVHH